MSVHVHAKMYIKDDGHLSEEIKKMIDASLKDEGCISYTFYQNFLNKEEYIMVEEWKSKELLNAHMKTPHFAALGEYMKKVSLKEMDIQIIEGTK
jgi:quinol monooxygenase YgiN